MPNKDNDGPPAAPAVAGGGGLAIANLRNGVVGEKTLTSYINDMLSFLNWCNSLGQEDYMTEYGKAKLVQIQVQLDGEGKHAHSMQVWTAISEFLCDAGINPIVDINHITPEGYMHYVLSLMHPTQCGFLSQSSYGNKCAALFHLFVCTQAYHWHFPVS